MALFFLFLWYVIYMYLLCIAGILNLKSLQISQHRIQSSIVHILASKHKFDSGSKSSIDALSI
jgi:hypothetical protein